MRLTIPPISTKLRQWG